MKKISKILISFVIMAALLLILFLVSVNLGSIKVSFGELLHGLFVEYNRDVATIYDLRFPRILIAMLGGAALAVSGVLFQAVLKNPLADPGIIGISSGASFAALIVTVSSLIFLYTSSCVCRRCDCIFPSVFPVMERRVKSAKNRVSWYRN